MTQQTHLAVTTILVVFTISFYQSVSAVNAVHKYGHHRRTNAGVCRALLEENPNAASGEYEFLTCQTGTPIEVYCEMGLNGGGYTFIKPQFLPSILNSELQAMITDRSSILAVPRLCNGIPIYAVLEQLPQFSDIPIDIALSEWTGYTKPTNADILGPLYLFFGFLPANITSEAGEEFGVQANGNNLTYSNKSSETLDSYIALFPNFREITPVPVGPGIQTFTDTPFCDALRNKAVPIPSARLMPQEYFMFLEGNFGGVGCNYETNPASIAQTCVISFAIGFK